MVYDLSQPEQMEEAQNMLLEFQVLSKKVDIKVVRNKRSLSQNNYLHLLLAYLGLETGYNLTETKALYKEMNRDLYYYYKPTRDDENVHEFIRSSAELTTEQMTRSIETLHEVSAANGIPLPLATDQGWLREIERAIELDTRL